jgi:hypothetical protein
MYDNIAEFIDNYETSKKNKKNMANKAKGIEKFLGE